MLRKRLLNDNLGLTDIAVVLISDRWPKSGMYSKIKPVRHSHICNHMRGKASGDAAQFAAQRSGPQGEQKNRRKYLKIAITGAGGFIGKQLVRSLTDSGYDLHLLSRSVPVVSINNVTYFRADLTSISPSGLFSFLEGCTVLIHCAGEINDISKMQDLHEGGTKTLIEASKGRIEHWIQLSSCGVYGRPNFGIITEESPQNPVGVYEVTKQRSEQMVVSAARDGKFSATILRPSTVYAADMPNGSLRSLLSMIERGLFFFIGKGCPKYNLVHVRDLVAAIQLCIKASPNTVAIYNLSSNPSLEESVYTAADVLGCPRPTYRLPQALVRGLAFVFGKLPGFPLTPSRVKALTSNVVYDSSRAERDIGWIPRVSLQEGLEDVLSLLPRKATQNCR